jgi:two-component sensor histidine kinase
MQGESAAHGTQRTSELEESNRLKENLLREIHHRVKNNLQIASSLMNMQKRKVMSPEAVEALNDSQNRILAIALTHQKIYQDKDTKAVNLKEYLNDLVSNQKKFFPHVKYIISSPEILIDLDKAVPLALITSELVTNAAKHAFPENISDPRLEILVTQETEDRVTILLKDNGVGLNQLFDIKKSDGLGFKIIQALCKQINATFWHRNDNGATFELEFENKL